MVQYLAQRKSYGGDSCRQLLPTSQSDTQTFWHEKNHWGHLYKISKNTYMSHSGLFFTLFLSFEQLTIDILLMTWFKPRPSGIGSNCSAIWATTIGLSHPNINFTYLHLSSMETRKWLKAIRSWYTKVFSYLSSSGCGLKTLTLTRLTRGKNQIKNVLTVVELHLPR